MENLGYDYQIRLPERPITRYETGKTNRLIQRFTIVERAYHIYETVVPQLWYGRAIIVKR